MKSDIEIARSTELKKIKQVAESISIPREEVENYGRYIAKIPEQLIDEEKVKQSNLILVRHKSRNRQDYRLYRPCLGAQQDWQEGDCGLARALFRPLLRDEGGSCRRRICTGASYG